MRGQAISEVDNCLAPTVKCASPCFIPKSAEMSPAAHPTSSDQAEIEQAKLEVYKKDVKEIVEVAYAKIDEIQRHETSIPDSEAHYLSQRAIEWQAHMKSEATKDALERVEHPAHVIHNLWVMRRQVERLELEWWQKIDWVRSDWRLSRFGVR